MWRKKASAGAGRRAPAVRPRRGTGRLELVIRVGGSTEQKPTMGGEGQTTCPSWTAGKRWKLRAARGLRRELSRFSLRFCNRTAETVSLEGFAYVSEVTFRRVASQRALAAPPTG